jgi:hypothetical protein
MQHIEGGGAVYLVDLIRHENSVALSAAATTLRQACQDVVCVLLAIARRVWQIDCSIDRQLVLHQQADAGTGWFTQAVDRH